MFRSVVLSRALLCTLPRGYCARFSSGLTHVSSSNQPCMVDVGGKAMTRRSAVASATISLPALVLEALRATGDAELYSKKVHPNFNVYQSFQAEFSIRAPSLQLRS